MPELSRFYGIIIRMFHEAGGKHNLPHIHATYADEEAVYDLEGNLLEGELPRKQERLVIAWMEIHYEELLSVWTKMQNNLPAEKIEPLR